MNFGKVDIMRVKSGVWSVESEEWRVKSGVIEKCCHPERSAAESKDLRIWPVYADIVLRCMRYSIIKEA